MEKLNKLELCITSKAVENVLGMMAECNESIHMAQDELDFCDRKTQDLLHELELCQMSYHERAKLANQLMDIRQCRRVAKDIIDVATPLGEWISNQQQAINTLKKCLGDMRRIENKQGNRVYFRRANDSSGEIIGG